jgi:hypothetical protein
VRGRDLADLLLLLVPILAVERDLDLLEGESRLLAGKPAAQRPARIVLVADDEFHRPRLAVHPSTVEDERNSAEARVL